MELLEISYEIGRYFQSLVDKSEYYIDMLKKDPKLYHHTECGLILEESYGQLYIHTPSGKLQIYSDISNLFKMTDKIKEDLGLVIWKERKFIKYVGDFGPYWAITKWKGKEIEWPKYRENVNWNPY